MTTVVIVEDEMDFVEPFVDLLKIKKIDVVGVGIDGKQAIELCKKHNPDFLIMDLLMPNFDGFYALERLQSTNTKIIIITGMITRDIFKKLESFSIHTLHVKPINLKNILNSIDSISPIAYEIF